MLGHGGEDMDGELVGERLIDCDEIDARFHEARQEMNVAAEPVELGHDQAWPWSFLQSARRQQGRYQGASRLLGGLVGRLYFAWTVRAIYYQEKQGRYQGAEQVAGRVSRIGPQW
jgi:hypothetical protein